MIAKQTRRSLLPALLALAGVVPSRAEAFEPHRGVAAIYDGPFFAGRPMANGRPFNPAAPTAAHRHLPLGTQAEVTNLRNGRTTTVTITDRGPYTPGRILDLSPHSARQIGLHDGLAQVEIRPLPQLHAAP